MKENDLSDEAFEEWDKTQNTNSWNSATGWREAVRRAKANPWQLLTIDELLTLDEAYVHLHPGVSAELERRKAK
jgi:hypothetical protein